MQPAPSTPTVSLFPFLTVLLATMGILVVMLVLVVQSTSQTSGDIEDDRRAEMAERIQEIQDFIELENLRRQGLLAIRPDLIEQLQAARMIRANVQSALDDLDRQAELLERQLAALDASESPTLDESTAHRRDELRAQIESLQQQLESQRSQNRAEPRKLYSIVPTSQVDGAQRRPIYIECTGHGLVIQPYALVLARHDMPFPGLPGNPLDAALATIREYDLRYGDTQNPARPYPLLVVRPSGAAMYGLARRAMSSWADEFGYELVEEDLPLEFGNPDPLLAQAVERAVHRAKQEQLAQARLVEEMNRHQAASREALRGVGGEGLQVDRANGGFMRIHGGEVEPRLARVGNAPTSTGNADASRAPDSTQSLNQPTAGRVGAAENSNDGAAAQPSLADEHGHSAQLTAGSESLARQRGQNWALGGRANGVPYRRPLRVVCHPHQLTIVAGRLSPIHPAPIEFASDVRDAVDPLVDSVTQLIESWGPPPPDGYWRPELRVSFRPESRETAARLVSLLRESGFDLIGEEP